MKKLIVKLKQWFMRNLKNSNDTIHLYEIEYNDPLTVSQMTTIVNRMISLFPGMCHPSTISTSPGSHTVQLKFTSTCMTGEGMASIGNRIMTQYQQTNTVKCVTLDNAQIWPLDNLIQ